jgi:hypothetical protein
MITMTYFRARDSEGQVLTARDMDEMATRTGHAGDEYTSWSLYQVDDSGESYAGYMIAGHFVSLEEIADHEAEEAADEAMERAAEAGLDELLADPEMAAEADRILAGEGGTILGIPFGPREERGE